MSPNEDRSKPSKCAVCDTYDLQGMWKCERDAMNLGKNIECWKCGAERRSHPL